jgi:hypothetical protein
MVPEFVSTSGIRFDMCLFGYSLKWEDLLMGLYLKYPNEAADEYTGDHIRTNAFV